MNRVAAPVTPKKRKRSESGAEPGDQGDQALTPTRKRLTPEEREALRVQKEEEKLKKAEEKKKKEEERERKKKELEEKKAQKELEKAKREAEREEKKKLKEEEKARKDEERKKKEEDKKRKEEEDKRKKEEDKLKKEEGKKKREEEKKKKEDERTKELEAKLKLAEKQKSILTSFLKKAAPPAAEVKPVAVKNKEEEEGDSLFHFHLLFKGVDVPPHTVRSSYLPTPVPGIERLASHEIEAALVNNTDRLPSLADWQAEVRSRKLARRAYEKLQREEARQRRETAGDDEDSDVMLVEQSVATHASSQRSLRRRMKFFKFHENNRPAYFGTCSKKSHCISPRNPFKQDTLLLDYECDSDDDWEEEGEGESLEDSDGEEDEEEEEAAGEGDDDDEEEDDGFMVPDGYLSEDEGVEDSDAEDVELGGKGKEKVKVSDGMDLEGAATDQRAREKERRRRWKEKHNEAGGKGGKVAKLRTVAVGPVFCMRSADVPLQYSGLFADFEVRVLADLTNGPIDPEATPAKEKAEPRDNSLPDVVLRDLIRNVHGGTMGMKNVVGRFYDKYVTEPSLQRYTLTKNGLIKKVREIAVREKRADDTKPRWHVAESLLQSLGMDEECAQILATRRQADSVTPRKKRTRPSLTGATTTTMTPTIAAGGAAAGQPATPSAAPVHRVPELPSTPSSAPASVVSTPPPASTPERKRGGAATKPKATKDIMNFFNGAAAASPSKSATATSSAATATTSTTTGASSYSLAPPASPSPASQSEEARNSPTVIAAGTAMDVDPLMPDIL